MTLEELLREHDLLCSAKLPIVDWVPRWRAYEAERQAFLHRGIDIEIEVHKRHGIAVSEPDAEAIAEKIHMLETENEPATQAGRKRHLKWMRL